MKKCINCKKESTGNFCVFCGGKLIEENQLKEKINIEEKVSQEPIQNNDKRQKQKSNRFNLICKILLIIIISLVFYIVYYKNTVDTEISLLNTQISSLRTQINQLTKKNTDLEDKKLDYVEENIKYKSKVQFLDENIVFVLDGYGNYYYTYDQMEQVTQGVEEYSYWAYNKEQARGLGYKAWK